MNVALLRAVNVAGHQPLLMAGLRTFFEELGLSDVKTLVNSGNVVFNGKTTEEQLEREAKKRLSLATDFFVRTPAQWAEIVDGNPFTREAVSDPGHLVVAVLKQAATALEWPGPEVIRVAGRHAYIFYPNGQGRSKLTNVVIEKKLGTRGTARNWNTVLKIAALLR